MFFVLSKLLGFFLSPFNVILLVLVAGVFVYRHRRKTVLLRLALVLFLIFSNTAIIEWLINKYQSAPVELKPGENYRYGVLLGGFSAYHKATGKGFFGESADRFIQAYRLYRLGHIRQIIIAGGNGYLGGNEFKEADFARAQLLQLGVPDSAIMIENGSRNTYENATGVKTLLGNRLTSDPIVLITNALHMPRAEAVFKKVGFVVKPFPCYFLKVPQQGFNWNDILPSLETLMLWDKLAKEWVGLQVYEATGKA